MALCLVTNSHVFFYDSTHAAGICLGTIQARTHVQLALACQQSMIRVQNRLRFTMKHVYGHSGHLGNECADHAASLGTCGLSLATMSPRVGFGAPLTLMDVSMGSTISVRHLNDFSTFGQTLLLFIRTEFSIGSCHQVHLCSVRFLRVLLSWVSFALSLLFLFDLVHFIRNK